MCNYISGRYSLDNYNLVGNGDINAIRDEASIIANKRVYRYSDRAYDAYEE